MEEGQPLLRSDSGYNSDDSEEPTTATATEATQARFRLPEHFATHATHASSNNNNNNNGRYESFLSERKVTMWERLERMWSWRNGGVRLTEQDGEQASSSLSKFSASLTRLGQSIKALEGYEFWLFIFSTAILPFALYTGIGDFLGWDDRRHKTPADWAHDLVGCIMWCSFLFTARGGAKVKLHWMTVVSTLVTSLGWGFLSEFKAFHHSLTTISKWGLPMYLAVSFALLVILIGAIFHILYAWQHNRMFSIVYRPLILSTVFSISTIVVSHVQNNTHGMPSTVIHFHHYQFSLLLSMSCILPTWWSRILQGICLGLFTNGIAAYGADNVLDQNWAKPNCGGATWSCKCAKVTCSCLPMELFAR